MKLQKLEKNDTWISVWQEIRKDTNLYPILKTSAEKAFIEGSDVLQIPDDVDKTQFNSIDGIEICNQLITSTDPKKQRDIVVIYIVEELLLPYWGEDKFWKQVDHILDNEREQNKNSESEKKWVTCSFILLHNCYGKNLLSEMDNVSKTGFWVYFTLLMEALPYLSFEPSSLCNLLIGLDKKIREDLAVSNLDEAVRQLSKEQKEIGEYLYKELPEDVPNLILEAGLGLSVHKFAFVHQQALDQTKCEDTTKIHLGMMTLARLDYKKNEKYIQETISRFNELKTDPNTDAILARAYSNLLKQKICLNEVHEALEDLSKNTDPNIQYEIASALFSNADCCGDAWFRESLINLKNVPFAHSVAIERIDGLLSGALQKEPSLVFNFLQQWVENQKVSHLTEVFSGICSCIQNHKNLLEEWITRWFSSDEKLLHKAARSIVESGANLRKEDIRLSHILIKQMSSNEVLFTLNKVIGYVLDSRALCSITFSALENSSEEVKQGVIDLFADYIGYNYPKTTYQFLEKKIEDDSKTEEVEVSSVIKDKMDVYYQKRKKVPLLNEFKSPHERVHLYRRAWNKLLDTKLKLAQKESILHKLSRPVTIKSGKSCFTEIHGNLTQPIEFKGISHSWEMPRGQQIDPIGQQNFILSCRSEKKV